MENTITSWIISGSFLLLSITFASFVFGMIYGMKKQKEKLRQEKFHIAHDVFQSWRSKLSKPLGQIGEFYLDYLRQNLEKQRTYDKK